MNANTAFYLQHAGLTFVADGMSYRAVMVNGEVQVYSASSLARSYYPAALRIAADLLPAVL